MPKYTPIMQYMPELESPFSVTLDYLVKNHVESKRREIATGNKEAEDYLANIITFVNSNVNALHFFSTLNRTSASEYWSNLRKNDSDTVHFIMYLTAHHRFIFADKIEELIDHIAKAYTAYPLDSNDKPTGVLGVVDTTIKKLELSYQELFNLFDENPWLVTVALLPFINPIG